MRRRLHSSGQAVVEFALAATVIFLLLAAAVDLGVIFFAVQGLTNAAQEGATYGSRWLTTNATTQNRQLNVPEIQRRVRFESGDRGGNGLLNLIDLNANDIDDSAEGAAVLDPSGQSGFILVRALADINQDGDPTNDGNALCANPAASAVSCYVHVVVRRTHNLFFPFTPSFANQITLSSSYYVLIRDSYEEAPPGNTPAFTTATPKPDPNKLVVKFQSTPTTFTSANSTVIEALAWDENKGTTNGTNIQQVTISIFYPNGSLYKQNVDGTKSYCLISGNSSNACGKISTAEFNGLPNGKYVVIARAVSFDGATAQVSFEMTK